ncbi:MAG: SRPBCC family protein [Ilumatobacteraceae bacterium]|jgi:carbon monoxide dehydrogenase subunit G|nr:SRPBCC family protein [Ilumatobacteraceae bacterium]
MDLNHSITVNQSIAETWKILTDLERIAPCLPGAQLQEVDGDVYKGVVKIKVGPIVAQFKGEAQFAERDDTNFKATLKASGRDTGGKGNASATITAQLTALSDTSTECNVVTDLAITGKVAQFGRGAMADISEKLIAQFADNLNTLIDTEGATAPATDTSAPAPSASDTSGELPKVRKIEGPAAEPLNLQDVAGGAMMKRILPLLAGLAALGLFLKRIVSRRRKKA